MPLTTDNLSDGTKKPKAARLDLRDLMQWVIDLASTASGKGAALVGFIQAGTGAVARTAQDKMRDSVSVKDFGATGGLNDAAAVGSAVAQASLSGGAIVLPSTIKAGSTRPNLGGVVVLGNKAITYDLGTSQGSAVANRRGRDLGQKVIGRAYLARFWNILSFFGVSYTASVYMTGDSVTAGYSGPILQSYLLNISGVTSVANNAIAGTTIEQWRTGTGSFSGSGKSLSDWLTSPTDLIYISFGINTPYYGGSPADFATSLGAALASIRAARDASQTSIVVVLPLASKDGGGMSIEGGWKRDEFYVHSIRALVEPLVDQYQFCLYDQSVETPEADAGTGINGHLWLDSAGVHPVFGNKYFLAGQIFDVIAPWQLRTNVVVYQTTANIAPNGAFTLPTTEKMRTLRNVTQAVGDGYVNMTAPAALTSGQTIGTVAVGFRPLNYQWKVDLMLYNGGGGWELLRGEIDNTTGAIKTSQVSVMSPVRIYMYGTWNCA